MKCFMLKKIMVHFLIIKNKSFKKNDFNDCLFVTGGKDKIN